MEVIPNELYEKVKPIVWAVTIWVKEKEEDGRAITAYAIREDGYLMSCAHGFTGLNLSEIKMKARRLDKDVNHRAKLVAIWPHCDMSLLKVRAKKGLICGKFGSGKLKLGENLMVLGCPGDLEGTGMLVRTAYPCISRPEFSIQDAVKCKTYVSDAWDKTPQYRILGHFINETLIRMEKEDGEMSTEEINSFEELLASIPVIQLTRFASAGGCSGAPIFNLKGKIVGMAIMIHRNHGLAIHVKALKTFRDANLEMDKKESKEESSKGKDKVESC